ncbi:MAG: hypothetical protein ACI9UJ_000710 [bacterium]|jgi:hypothetical protein
MISSRSDLRISNLSVTEFVNCFSLLVVSGSISTSYFFGKIYKAQLGISFYWLLASTIWIIYTLDHILDGFKMKDESSSIRHLIHYKYRNTIFPTIAALMLFNAYIAYAFLPSKLLIAGAALAAIVGVYFIVVHYLKTQNIFLPKEFIVSVIVACGMVMLPGIAGDMTLSVDAFLMIISMTLVNFTNLLLFSYHDYSNDIRNGLVSAATQWGLDQTKTAIMYGLSGAFMCFAIWTFFIMSPIKLPISIALLIMLNILLVIHIQEERFAEGEKYRFWGDFIFMVPGLVWWVFVDKLFF